MDLDVNPLFISFKKLLNIIINHIGINLMISQQTSSEIVTYQQCVNKIIMQSQQEDKIIDDGFESEEQLDPLQIYLETKQKNDAANTKEQFKFILPPPQDIVEKRYSLQPDMLTGWSPRKDRPSPIPTVFQCFCVDSIIENLLTKKNNEISLCYLGPRYDNTFYAWYKMPFKYPYSHIQQPQHMKLTNRAFCGQNPSEMHEVNFDSFFESANLDCAFKVGQNEYDLYLRVDSNTKGHLQWFNFKISNLKKAQKYKFNLCNFQKQKTLYSRGMKPYMLSKKAFEKQGLGWEQGGENLKYQKKPSKTLNLLQQKLRFYYKLSFQCSTEYENDEIQLAYCVPYNYTDLNNFLLKIKQKVEGEDFFKEDKLCLSLGGLQIPLITIHEEQKAKNEDSMKVKRSLTKEKKEDIQKKGKSLKKCIILSGRVHPGQSNSSFVMQGFINFLCSNHKYARELRTKIIFKIIPMLNPDGVSLGNFRTGLSGKDFNRQYTNPDKYLFPEIFNFKNLVIENKKKFGDNLLLYLDFHGHSVKKNVFMYGPQFTIMEDQYYKARIFPRIIDKKTHMFRYYSCIFKITEEKKSTARAIFLSQYKINLSYTIQASNGSYYDTQNLKDIPFNDKTWIQMGKQIAESLKKYVDIVVESQIQRKEKLKNLRQRKQKNLRTSKLIIRKKERIMDQKKQFKKKQYKSHHQMFGDDIMKYILDEIKYVEEIQKKQDKLSEDQISEGNSDKQSDADDLEQEKLNILYQAIKTKKKNEEIKHSNQSCGKLNLKAQKFMPIQQEYEEKYKKVNTQRKSLGSSNESSYRRLLQTKRTKVVNLKFQQNLLKQPDSIKKRPTTSVNRKNFQEFVVSQNKKTLIQNPYSTIKKRSPRSSGENLIGESIFRELQKIKASNKKFKREIDPLKCTTIQPLPKY